MNQSSAFLFSKTEVAPDVFHLFLYIPGEGLHFTPGQYIILTVPASPAPLKRLYSLAGSNTDKNILELLIKLVPDGAASSYIRSLNVGSSLEVSGPAGLFSLQKTPAKKIFMATGTGFAPIRSFLRSCDLQKSGGSLYWGVKNLSETYLFDELLALKEKQSTFSFTYCLSQQPTFDIIPADLLQYYRAGHIDVVWSSQTPLINPEDEYYLCGSRTVIEALRLLLLSRGVSKSKLFFEKY